MLTNEDTLGAMLVRPEEPVTAPLTPHAERKFYPTAYSAVGRPQQQFRQLCEALARDLPFLMRKVNADAVAVRGTSGYAVAFGMRMVSDIHFIICRKSGEASHGSQLAVADDRAKSVSRYIIVDDCIDSGSTVRGIMKDLDPCQCAAIVTYNDFTDMGLSRLHDDIRTFAGVPRLSFKN